VGTVEDDEGRQLVIADIPGLIEGAAEGAGLGHEFLAHVERTSLLVHVVDVAPLDGTDAWEAFKTVRGELSRYGAGLEERPFFVALNKADLLPEEDVEARVAEWTTRLTGAERVIATSTVTGAAITDLRREIFRLVPQPEEDAERPAELAEHVLYRPSEAAWSVSRTADGAFRVSGAAVERLVGRHDLENDEALAYIEERLNAMGIVKRLESEGFRPGDEVEIGDVAFALYPGVPQEG
jgi:GTP-binding protein